jgi:hypothetical protein
MRILTELKHRLEDGIMTVVAFVFLVVVGILLGIVRFIPLIVSPRNIKNILTSIPGFYLKNKSNILITLMFLGVASLISMAMFQYTERPEFCITCHLMKPEYLSYKASPHGGIHSCLECHYEPGVVGLIEGKLGGMISLLRYVSGMYTLPIESHISSDLCFRCHKMNGTLNGTINYEGVEFRHLHKVEGGEKKCGFCHSQPHEVVPHADCNECHAGVVHGNKTTIDMGTCMQCHSKRGVSSRCDLCHDTGSGIGDGIGDMLGVEINNKTDKNER